MSNTIQQKDDDGEEDVSERRGLTEKQAAFVRAFVEGPTAGNGTKSCVVAGYSEKSASMIACALAKLPHVQAAIEETLREAIGTTLTVQAVECIRQIIADTNAPLKLRGAMAVEVVRFSGLGDRVAVEKARQTGLKDGKKLTELTRDDLAKLVAAGAAVLQATAPGKVIEGQVLGDGAQNSAQPPAIAAE